MDYLRVFVLVYLLAVTPTTSNDVLSKIRQIIDGGKGQDNGKGCIRLQGSVKCSLHVNKEETRVIDQDKYILPDNSECFTYDGCLTCRDGSWVTSACQGEEPLHRQKRFWGFGIILAWIIGVVMTVGGIACKIFCKGDNGDEYKPPKFTRCKGPESPINTPLGKRAATVTWQKPAYEAGNSGTPKLTLVSTTGDSGDIFTAGYYNIVYQLVDNQAYKDFCLFSFEVKVRTCSWPASPDNGKIRCGSGDIIYGDTCQISCNQGYDLEGQSEITCEANEEFNYNIATCRQNQCPVLTRPDHSNGFNCTDGNNYNSICSLNCDTASGFTSSPRLTICRSTQTWLLPYPECSDTLDPEFTSCPSEAIQHYADRGKSTAVVTWEPLTATDNSGTVNVEQVDGLQPGQTFSEGSTMIKYTATDPSGHIAYCSFAVNVVTLSCKLPDFDDKNLIFNCAQGYKYGSQCTVSCETGLPLNGTDTITCEKDDSVIPQTYWDLHGGNPPYCIKRPCEGLKAPIHGALTCDSNMGGAFCVMSCNEKWDIPRTAVAVNMYVCGWSTGKWSPSSDVPDCTKKHLANHLRLKSELYYFSGDCNDNKTLEEIKQKFVKVLDDSGFWGDDGCLCTVQDITVVCGTGRRKRDVNTQEHDIEKRSVPAAIITWVWVVPIDSGETNRTKAINTADGYLMNRANKMYELVQNNSLNIGVAGFELKSDSFGFDQSDVVCAKGYLGIFGSGTCSPCPTGSMYSEAADKCTMCQPGTYQDEEGQFQCEACPSGTTTINEGSRSQDKCLELCRAGHFSNSSVVPCDECPVGKYQTVTGSTACMSCQQGFTTSNTASTNATSCQPFDVIVEGPATVSSKRKLSNSTEDFTVSIWLRAKSANGSVSIKQPDGTFPMRLHFGQTNKLNLFGNQISGLEISTSSWVHVSVVYNHGDKTVTMYNNGVADSPRTLPSVSTPALSLGSQLQLELEANSVITVRSMFVVSSALSANDVKLLASSCDSKPNDFAISLSDLTAGGDQRNVRVATPTTCDAVDECKQNTPCNGHPCINLPGSYRCKCQDGFSGLDCSKPPDYCLNNECQNGICKNTSSNYMCKCYDEFKGRFCDEHIVNGGWSGWSNWDQCSLTCGGGTVTRRRRCDNPEPTRPEGQNCTGSATETGLCNTEDCPVCDASHVRRGIGSIVRCNGTSSALDCIAVCRKQNYVIDETDRLRVSCRNGVWDSEIPKVASCTKVVSPSQLTIDTMGTLNTKTCLSEHELSNVASSISHNAGSLQCGTDASCQTAVHVQDEGCKASGGNRSTGTVVTITQTFSIPDGNLRLGDFMASKTVSPQLQKLIEAVKVLEASAEQLQNDSSIFNVTVDGSQFSVLRESVNVSPGVSCPAGAVVRDMMCVYCSPGTYNKDGRCKYCDFGTYQDESGKTVCKPCPAGKSTEFIGSTALEECTVSVEITTTPSSHDDRGDKKGGGTLEKIGPIIGGLSGAVALIGLIVFVVSWKRFRTKPELKYVQNQDLTYEQVENVQNQDPNYEQLENVQNQDPTKEQLENIQNQDLTKEQLENVQNQDLTKEQLENVQNQDLTKEQLENVQNQDLTKEQLENVQNQDLAPNERSSGSSDSRPSSSGSQGSNAESDRPASPASPASLKKMDVMILDDPPYHILPESPPPYTPSESKSELPCYTKFPVKGQNISNEMLEEQNNSTKNTHPTASQNIYIEITEEQNNSVTPAATRNTHPTVSQNIYNEIAEEQNNSVTPAATRNTHPTVSQNIYNEIAEDQMI